MENCFYYINPETALSLIEQCEAQKRNHAKSGTNSKAFIVGEFVVLKAENIVIKDTRKFKDKNPFNEVIERLQELKKQGVNVVPVLGYSYDPNKTTDFYGKIIHTKAYVIQPKARGQELWVESLLNNKEYILQRAQVLACASQEQYNKFINDFLAIINAGIKIDAVEENFFYDEKEGFSFIDLNTIASAEEKEHNTQFLQKLHCRIAQRQFEERKDLTEAEREQLIKNNKQILEKFKNAFTNKK